MLQRDLAIYCTGWLRGTAVERGSLTGELSLSCSALDLQLTGDHYVGKLSAVGQLTRPTQPFILSGYR